jgi:hypothetical protein
VGVDDDDDDDDTLTLAGGTLLSAFVATTAGADVGIELLLLLEEETAAFVSVLAPVAAFMMISFDFGPQTDPVLLAVFIGTAVGVEVEEDAIGVTVGGCTAAVFAELEEEEAVALDEAFAEEELEAFDTDGDEAEAAAD